ncbi:patatin-like phospholipase family protein [Parageobacillus thermoglucosidasius]|uniref:patatin-like phospholipase family protein n=1 Tax=Parageobacillus thermoglucosidasius TaxID=1426 RepID=UPI0001D17A9A|nr:patatin-like phospholipase family protein [Parageobacillus thermoglucosidasius]AEH49379.1 Patatin [Parageobacillus thermoglucosidasius C56-YS93]MBY6268358.1 patatin [Parageobacillus thermoglucosidasius]MED4904583.1 patatin-like phospholipase family protein [Parageobacillus thermoglucosidasius]MED4915786.1 patatin-like phospholipase family protein [Parageobacillus thermoglucosidasius]MED4944115.1 patatin-like phospholipase family protein [Parageobacillus thermoglucosidasius]
MKVGLALGGGAVRGLAHIGVLKVLKKHQIPIDFIAGTSMGGAIGGLVAAGIDIEEMEEFILTTPSYRFVDIGILKRGIFAGNKIYAMLIQFLEQKGLGDIRIEDLNIPFRAVSVDLIKGEVFVFEKGSLSLAIRATTSVPGIFSPVHYQDKVLVDGGILNNLPADLLREAGMDVVMAVDVEREHEEEEPRNIFDVVYRSFTIMMTRQRRANLRYADVVFRPEVGHILAFDTTRIQECIEAGEREAQQKIQEVLSFIK